MCRFVFLLYFLFSEMNNHCLSLHISCITALCLEKWGLLNSVLILTRRFTCLINLILPPSPVLSQFLGYSRLLLHQDRVQVLFSISNALTCPTPKALLHLVDSYHLQISAPLTPAGDLVSTQTDSLKPFHHSVCMFLTSPSTLVHANDSYS